MGAKKVHVDPLFAGLAPAVLVAVEGDRVTARVEGAGPARVLDVRLLATAGFRPTVGDHVLLAGEFVVGAIEAADVGARLTLADGAEASVHAGALELRDDQGRLLLRYDNGALEIASPTADLKLAAPRGRVVIEAATDVSIAAARDLVHVAGRRVDVVAGDPERAPRVRVEPGATTLAADALQVDVKKAAFTAGEARIVARAVATTAETIATNVARYELSTEQLVERAGEAFRDVLGLLQQRIGRARVLVEDTFELTSKRTRLESEKETSIDGEKILIG